MSDLYYLDENQQVAGPVSMSELRTLAASGKITPETLVAPVGHTEWIRYDSWNSATPPSALPPVPSDSVPPGAKNSPWAVASLVFGISTFVTGCLGGLPAIITGAVALSQLKKRLRGEGLAVAGICLGAFSIFWTGILAGLAVPAINAAMVKAKQTSALVDARQVGIVLFAEANEHNGVYPATLEEIPADRFGDASTRDRLLYFRGTKELRWILTPGLTTSAPPETPLLVSAEDPLLHVGKGQVIYSVGNSARLEKKPKR